MKIVFNKIGFTAKPIKSNFESVFMKGTLEKRGYHQVLLDAKIYGNLELACDRCGDTLDINVDSTLQLKLRDAVSEDKDDLDIIEFLDGVIDIKYIIKSEINTIKSAYHYCDNCDNNDEEFEIEY